MNMKQTPNVLEHVKKQISEYYCEVYRYHRQINPEFEAAQQRQLAAAEVIKDELLKKTSPVQDYIDCFCDVVSQEHDFLYLQGHLDCVTLLRTLGVLS